MSAPEIDTRRMPLTVCLGEGMLELSRKGEDWRMGFGGDTLNTAIHLARGGCRVAYLSALGNDPFSADLRQHWEAQGVDCSLVLTHPSRSAGLYAITTAPDGERSFTYWREFSAARAMFEVPTIEAALAQARVAELLCFSLISMAILPDADRHKVIALAQVVRANGGKVAFDGNYRPRLWEDVATARHWREACVRVTNIGLPTLDDETALLGLDTAETVLAAWQDLGCEEVVVKAGADGCLLPNLTLCPVPEVLFPHDTSGAGDAFNGGYLAARVRGASILQAAQRGHALAGWTVMRAGAIPPVDAMAPY